MTFNYLQAYIVGGLLGIVSEIIISRGNHHCINNFTGKCLLSMSIFNLYGWGAVIVTYILKQYNMPVWWLILSSTILISMMECVGGKLSNYVNNGKKTWNYPDSYIPVCNGYVSLLSSAYFAVMICVFIYIYHR